MHTHHTHTLLIKAITSLHVGSGDDSGIVDLPIQRELVTGYPKIEASSLKGALRSRLESLGAEATKIHLAFGYDNKSKNKGEDFSGTGNDNKYAEQFMGALALTDARLLLFPVRSMKGTFALITCPYVLKRFADDTNLLSVLEKPNDLSAKLNDLAAKLKDDQICLVKKDSPLKKDNNVILEEYKFTVLEELADTGIVDLLPSDLSYSNIAIVSDDVFADFTQLFTERMTRNKIDDKKGTVEDGGLFTEEYLPAESILYSLVMADAPKQPKYDPSKEAKDNPKALPKSFSSSQEVGQFISDEVWGASARKFMQVGGNVTVGKGIVELQFVEAKETVV